MYSFKNVSVHHKHLTNYYMFYSWCWTVLTPFLPIEVQVKMCVPVSARQSRMCPRPCRCLRAQEGSQPQWWKRGIHSATLVLQLLVHIKTTAVNWVCVHSIFRKPYFLTRFLPALLAPRVVRTVPCLSLLALTCFWWGVRRNEAALY